MFSLRLSIILLLTCIFPFILFLFSSLLFFLLFYKHFSSPAPFILFRSSSHSLFLHCFSLRLSYFLVSYSDILQISYIAKYTFFFKLRNDFMNVKIHGRQQKEQQQFWINVHNIQRVFPILFCFLKKNSIPSNILAVFMKFQAKWNNNSII